MVTSAFRERANNKPWKVTSDHSLCFVHGFNCSVVWAGKKKAEENIKLGQSEEELITATSSGGNLQAMLSSGEAKTNRGPRKQFGDKEQLAGTTTSRGETNANDDVLMLLNLSNELNKATALIWYKFLLLQAK